MKPNVSIEKIIVILITIILALSLNQWMRLLTTNITGPFSGSILMWLAGIAFVVLVSYKIAQILLKTYRRSKILAISSAAVLLLLYVIFQPVACDFHESWVEVDNKKCDCAGWNLYYYPQGYFDYHGTTYCIGFELPVEENVTSGNTSKQSARTAQ